MKLHPVEIDRIWLHRNPLNALVISIRLDDGQVFSVGSPDKLFRFRPLAEAVYNATGIILTKMPPAQWDRKTVELVNALKYGNEE